MVCGGGVVGCGGGVVGCGGGVMDKYGDFLFFFFVTKILLSFSVKDNGTEQPYKYKVKCRHDNIHFVQHIIVTCATAFPDIYLYNIQQQKGK